MNIRAINAADAPAPRGGYAQAVEISGFGRLLFISGQIPTDAEERVPKGFEAQCRKAWANLEAQLAAAGMGINNLVKVTTFLADRNDGIVNRHIRQQVLGAHTPALTVIVAGIFESAWLIEIEAVAAA